MTKTFEHHWFEFIGTTNRLLSPDRRHDLKVAYYLGGLAAVEVLAERTHYRPLKQFSDEELVPVLKSIMEHFERRLREYES